MKQVKMNPIRFCAILAVVYLLFFAAGSALANDTAKVKKPVYKVMTASEAVYDEVLAKFKPSLIRASVIAKENKHFGRYLEFTLTFPVDRKDEIEAFMLKTWGENTNKAKN